jgi:hypothetical protein
MIFINSHRVIVMIRNAILSSFTLLAIILGETGNARADLSRQAIDLVSSLNQNIAQVNQNHKLAQLNDSRYRSMLYVKQGLIAQRQGNITDAAFNYYQAIQIDSINPHAFMGIGMLLGNTQEGLDCIKTAAILFDAEGDREGHKLAMDWLRMHQVIE